MVKQWIRIEGQQDTIKAGGIVIVNTLIPNIRNTQNIATVLHNW